MVFKKLVKDLGFIVCGIGLLNGFAWSFLVLGFSSIALLVLGIVSAWDMLVWMVSKVR